MWPGCDGLLSGNATSFPAATFSAPSITTIPPNRDLLEISRSGRVAPASLSGGRPGLRDFGRPFIRAQKSMCEIEFAV